MAKLWMRPWMVALSLAGCAGSDSDGARPTQPTSAQTAGSRATTAGGTSGSNGLTGFSNPSQTLPPPTPAAVPDAGTQPQGTTAPPAPGSSIEPISLDACMPSNTAGLDAAETQRLMGGGDAGKLRVLYPYDGTVFPRGLLPPTLMWDGVTDTRAVYLHMRSSRFEYRGCLKPTAEGQLTLPEDVWVKAGEKTMGSSDPFTIEVSVLGADPVGPVRSTWTIAQATIKGSIFYNSYNSMLGAAAGVGGFGGFRGGGGGGIVLRIPSGGKAEAFVSTSCNGCHSVSANGSRLLSLTTDRSGQAFKLDPNTAPNPMGMNAGNRTAYGALYPDGSVYLATSTVIDVAQAALLGGFSATTDALLYSTDDGSLVPNTGIPPGALMPTFSPDGTLLVFNDFAIEQAHGLALMTYDTKTHAASGYRMIFRDDTMRPAWPFVLPDNGGVIFTRTTGTNFSGEGVGLSVGGLGIGLKGPHSDVYITDIKTGTTTIVARAMGYATAEDEKSGKTYLPFGAEELHMSYYPTVSPVAGGGYFWMFFDAVRHYGNLGQQRQLWGAAVDIAPNGDYSVDRSHPAFYLPGQEFGTGNHRAFAALDPCRKDGDSCTSGTDCCGGFCYVEAPAAEFAEAKGSCAAQPPPTQMCSKTNERCTTSADCCPPASGQTPNSCIAGFCAVLKGPE